MLLPPARKLCFRRCLSVCLSVLTTLHKNFWTDLAEIFSEGWQCISEKMIKSWWRSGSPSEYRDCFPDSSLLGHTESGINQLRSATPQCMACALAGIIIATSTSLRHRPTTDSHDRRTFAEVCTVPIVYGRISCACAYNFVYGVLGFLSLSGNVIDRSRLNLVRNSDPCMFTLARQISSWFVLMGGYGRPRNYKCSQISGFSHCTATWCTDQGEIWRETVHHRLPDRWGSVDMVK